MTSTNQYLFSTFFGVSYAFFNSCVCADIGSILFRVRILVKVEVVDLVFDNIAVVVLYFSY